MEFEPLTALDGETFRRVWERVMPDQSLSPVVVRDHISQVPKEPERDYVAQLEGVMDGVRQWQARLDVLCRQSGGKTGLRTLLEGERSQLRRLDGLYFLLTGRRYTPRGGRRWENERWVDSLRRGFFLEMDWAECYRQMEGELPQIGLQEAAHGLYGGALEQSRQLRGMLETSLPQARGE